MNLNFDNLPKDFYDPSTELSPEYLAQRDAELERYFQDQENTAPVLDPADTALFFGKTEEGMTIENLQSCIREEYAWCREQGVDTFLLDCSTPIGLLALETLDKLRTPESSVRLLAFQSTAPSKRESYRCPKESEIEFIQLLLAADYLYRLPFDTRTACPLIACADFWCNGKRIELSCHNEEFEAE